MSAATVRPADHDSVTPTLRRAGRRAAPWVLAVVVLLIVAVLYTLAVGGTRNQDPLGSDNPGPSGGQALAEVLRAQGVTVTRADSLTEVTAQAGTDATVLLYDSGFLLDADRLAELGTLAKRLVVIEPTNDALTAFAPGAAFSGYPGTKSLSAACALPEATRAGSLTPGDSSFRPVGDVGTDVYCFPDAGGGYQLAQSTASGIPVTLLADATPFDNDHVLAAGNASLALNLLGAGADLVWYIPTLADLPIGSSAAPSLGELTPEWVTPVLLLLIVVFLAAAVWRGRRFGPLVVENLPVTVRASETMEGRARLYQRSGARGRALDALRVGTIGRIATTLALSRSASVDDVVASAALATGRPAPELRRLLLDAAPLNDRELVALSDDLLELERDVRSAADPR